jgi:hypothetical protein
MGKSLEDVIRETKEMGFDRQTIEIAYKNVNGDGDKVIDEIFRMQDQSNQYTTVYMPSHRNR